MNCRYTVAGQVVELSVANDLLAVRFQEPAPYSVRTAVATVPELDDFNRRFEVPEEKFTVFCVAPTARAPEARLSNAIEAVRGSMGVERITPVFEVGEHHAIATDRLLVGFKRTSGAARMLRAAGCRVVERNGSEYLVCLAPDADPFSVAEKLASSRNVEYAEPDFVTFGSHVARPADGPRRADPLAPDQYAIRITKAEEAWKLQKGDSSIRIAILDEGVDTTHDDLVGAVIGQYDGVDADTYQEPKPWDAHGSACAGLAAATHDNAIGIKGIAGGCSLIAVRIAYSPYRGGRWVTSNSWIRRAIDWSWANGADVLSNSWGGGAPSNAITNAFERARTQGRGGKGCVVVIAAGNANSLHDYPGNLDEVLTVSASNELDEPKTPTSSDGETWWGSNYGPKIDVAAPGVHNFTTDNTGSGGYNQSAGSAGDYVSDFNGTSSACPIVAGAAALVLSANPDLTEAEVREVIRTTADKVGPLPYVNGRNDRMGHGRVNVLGAVRAVQGERIHSVPGGKHSPVSNTDPDSEREVNVLMRHPDSVGEARTARARIRDGVERLGEDTTAEAAAARTSSAPDTEGLRNIGEASYGAPGPEPETVHGRDDRRRIENTQNFPWRLHASLLITARDGSSWIGTGWFIGDRTLVTAGHVVYIKNSGVPGRDGWVRRIAVMPGRNADRLPFGVVNSEVFHSVTGWTEDHDPQFDYGAISIPTPLGAQVGALGFGVLSRDELLQARGNLSGYPGDKPSGTQWYHHNRIASVTARKVFYDIDTAGGQSGSAVYMIGADGGRVAFGIHAYGGETNNSATRITTPVFQNLTHWMNR